MEFKKKKNETRFGVELFFFIEEKKTKTNLPARMGNLASVGDSSSADDSSPELRKRNNRKETDTL